MSKPGKIYRLNWQSFHETTDLQCFVDISDNDNLIPDDEDPEIIDLQPGGEPARVSVIDTDENIFTVVLSQQLTLQFISSDSVDITTFIGGSSQRWGVHYYLATDDQTLFKGFLNIDDHSISEEFLFPPNVVTLTANDGLALLKDIPLVNADGNNPTGYHKISDYLSWVLRKTGLDLSLFAAFNIKSIDDVSDISTPNNDPEHFFYVEYLEAKTFEDEIGTSVDNYKALEMILGFEARLFQFQGAWWIVRVDEVEDAQNGLYVTEFDSSGSFVSNLGSIDFRKYIAYEGDKQFLTAATVTASLARKSARLDYKYTPPAEVPCNTDFSRGTNEVVISSTEKHYDIECWTLYENRPPTTPSVNATAYLVKKFTTDGYEESRYAEISTCASSVEQLLISEEIPVDAGDKFAFQVDVSYDGQIETGGSNYDYEIAQIWLYGDDGSYYTLHGGDTNTATVPEWVACTSSFNTFQKFFHVLFNGNDDDTEWRTCTFMYGPPPPCPKSGKIKIVLCHKYKVTGFKIRFQNLQFDYIPKINGSYQKYSGQYHTTNQSGDYKAKIQEEVFISDSPKKLFKGALFEFDGSNYVLSGLFYNAAVFPSGPPSSDYHHRYGEIQLYDVWNQFKREMRTIEGSVQGIDLDKTRTVSGDTLPFPVHLVNKYILTYTSSHALNKMYMALHFDRNESNGEWGVVLKEVYDTTQYKDYSNHDFKYITDG